LLFKIYVVITYAITYRSYFYVSGRLYS